MEKSKVYFTSNLTEEGLLNIFKSLSLELEGNVAIKVHSGEEGNQNYLKPEFLKPLVEYVGGTMLSILWHVLSIRKNVL